MRLLSAVLLVLLATGCRRTTTYSAAGDVVAVDDPPTHVTISHEDIPGLMPAMTMRFLVRSPEVLAGVSPGMRVRFQVVRRGDDLQVTLVVPEATGAEGRPGVHDHTPHHGGVVAMIGMQHLEALASAEGRIRVYLTDVWRKPVPLDGVTGTVTLALAGARRTLTLAARDGALEAGGPPFTGPSVNADVQVVRDGAPVEAHFVLPLGGTTVGAAEAPAEGCVPVVPEPGVAGRVPRCAITFRKPVAVIASTADGTAAIVSVLDTGITAWRLPAGTLITGFAPPPPVAAHANAPPHHEAATAIVVSPDGTQAAVGFEHQVLRYATASGRLLAALPGPGGGLVRSVAWSPDGGRLLVTAFYDPAAHVFRAGDGHEIRRLPVEREGAAVAFSSDGRLAAVGSELGPIAVFDLTRREPRLLTGSTQAIETLAFAGGRLVSATADGVLRVWDPERGDVVLETQAPTPLRRLAVAPGGRLAATAGLDRTIRLHDLATGAVVEALGWHRYPVNTLAWAGTTLVVGDGEGKMALWDLADRTGE